MTQLGQLKTLLSAEEKKKVQIVAVSPDTPEKLRELREKLKAKGEGEVDYLLLSDAQASVIKRYGLLNEAAAQKGRLIPHPTTYVIDGKGKVTWRFTEVNYKVRPTNEMVQAALRRKGFLQRRCSPMSAKRKVEVFSAGCPACEETIDLVNRIACPSCEVSVLDMRDANVASRAVGLDIRSVPAMVIDGQIAGRRAGRGPEEATLRAAGLGQPV